MSDVHCYCETVEVDELLMLKCQSCNKFFHLDCLKRGKPSPLEGDVLFDFVCSLCTEDGFEQCTRLKLHWTHVIMLALYNLQLQGVGKCGYFRWREHVCSFIDRNWTVFFGFSRKKTNTWHGTVAGTLSAGCPRYFTSGFQELKEQGWWKLTSSHPITQQEFKGLTAAGGAARNNRKTSSQSLSKVENTHHCAELKLHKSKLFENEELSDKSCEIDEGQILKGSSKIDSLQSLGLQFSDDTDSESDDLDINPGSVSPVDQQQLSLDKIFDEVSDSSDALFQGSGEANEKADEQLLSSAPIAKQTKWQKQLEYHEESSNNDADTPIKKTRFVQMSLYEEKCLLSRLEMLSQAVASDAEARRLRRKLILRQQKRERNLPFFCLSSFLNSGGGEPSESLPHTEIMHNDKNELRILDRYCMGYKQFGSIQSFATTFITKLVGADDTCPGDIISPYTTRILKPYIWRDYESQPPKLQLLKAILKRCKDTLVCEATQATPIDYCYVRPQHIPSINLLCRDFFWPGIDLSESLRYPDFSCVALYKKIVVGFAFMVPDVKYNEAYISFIFTHPEWRGAGIATFMLYHLIQTCMGKDVTLHVSATNPALLLYQKFGFKIEEFVVDFYDKYFPVESKECKHAVFLRLCR